jgi:GR25 family glycosyltransferase involved in LPS biosynthesis
MKFFCLNIETAQERRAHCEREFAKAGIGVDFVNAFDARYNGIRHQNGYYRTGHLGCYLSHMWMIEEVRRYDYSPAVIFEDDVCLADDFDKKLRESVAALPDDWEVAFPGWWPKHFDHGKLKINNVNGHWMQVTGGELWGCHCYMVNGRRGGDKLIKLLQPILGHVDNMILGAIVRGDVKGYFARSPLADQSGSFKSQTNVH